MSHKLWRLREKLCNTPLLVDKQTFDSVVSYLDSRNSEEVVIEAPQMASDDERDSYRRFLYNPDTQTAVMTLEGPLSYRPITFWGMDCGGANYTHLKEDFELAIADGAKTIAMMVDSGGGEAHGMIDSAEYIRNLLDESGVKLITYVDGIAASAAYGLSCISDEIIASGDSELGSIGVLIELRNNSEQLKNAGIQRTYITAGDEKIPYDEDGGWREGFLEDLQHKVDSLYVQFTEHVADMRNMPVDAVRATQAKTFLASEAVTLGLADKVMTPEEFYTYLADEAQTNMENTPVLKDRIFKFARNEENEQMQLTELQTQLEGVQVELSSVTEAKATLEATLAEMVAENEKLAIALASKEEVVAKLETELATFKADTQLAARKAKLAAVLSADKVDARLEMSKDWSDAAFDLYVEDLQSARASIEQSELMQEVGQDSEEVANAAEGSNEAGDAATLEAIKRLQKR